MNIVLTADEHCFGRCVEDSYYRIESLSVSAKHCTIFRERATTDGELDSNLSLPVFIKDTRLYILVEFAYSIHMLLCLYYF